MSFFYRWALTIAALTVLQIQPYSKNIKIDDDDGHYIVVPDADLTDKCKMFEPFSWPYRY